MKRSHSNENIDPSAKKSKEDQKEKSDEEQENKSNIDEQGKIIFY